MRVVVSLIVGLIALAGCAFPAEDAEPQPQDEAGWMPGDPVPTLQARKGTHNGVFGFAIIQVINGPLPYGDTIIKTDCGWHTQGSAAIVEVGDYIECFSDDVLTIVHAPSGGLVYSNCGGCTEAINDPDEADDEPSNEDETPELSFSKSASDRTITVVRADKDLQWSDMKVEGSAACTKPSGPISAGDRLECGQGSVSMTWIPSGVLIYSTTFA